MAVYYITICSLAGAGFLFKKKETKAVPVYLLLAFVVLTLLASMRYAIGFDYFAYRNIYTMISQWTFHDILVNYQYEPLYFVLCKIFSLMHCPYEIFLLCINALLLFTAMLFIYRYSKLPWISVYLYITLQFLAYDMNLIRQSLAICFFMLSYPYLRDRKLLPYRILIIVGGLFHNSLWFMYPAYIFLPKKNTRTFTIGMILLAVTGYLFFEPFFNKLQPFLPLKYISYEGTYFWNSSTFDYVIPAAIYALFIYLFRSRIEDSHLRNICLNSALLHFLISLFITKHFILERFAVYPFIFSLIAIPEIIVSYQTDTENAGRPQILAQTRTSFTDHCILSLNYRTVLLLFLLSGACYFMFAASKGFHHVYPYVSLLDRSYSAPVPQTL